LEGNEGGRERNVRSVDERRRVSLVLAPKLTEFKCLLSQKRFEGRISEEEVVEWREKGVRTAKSGRQTAKTRLEGDQGHAFGALVERRWYDNQGIRRLDRWR